MLAETTLPMQSQPNNGGTVSFYLTIRAALGTRPASLSVLDMSMSPWNVCRGNVVEKLLTAVPVSLSTAWASSNSVVSAGSVFMMFPLGVCSRRRASFWFALGLGGAAAAAAAGVAVVAAASGALPSRTALASSALRLRSALSASILALMRFLASMSSSFSCRLRAASLVCSLRCSSSFASCDSLVDFWRIF